MSLISFHTADKKSKTLSSYKSIVSFKRLFSAIHIRNSSDIHPCTYILFNSFSAMAAALISLILFARIKIFNQSYFCFFLELIFFFKNCFHPKIFYIKIAFPSKNCLFSVSQLRYIQNRFINFK